MSETKLKVITPLVILSYPHIAAPQKATKADAKDKYSASLVITKETLEDAKEKALFDAMQRAALAAVEAKWSGKSALLFASETFRKGFRRDAEAKGYPAGSIFVNARSEQQPGCVYSYAEPGTTKPARVPADKIKAVFYPGAIVRASLTAFAYDNNGNKGVSFALNNLQFVKDGERIDGRVAAEDEFNVDLTSAPADLASILS